MNAVNPVIHSRAPVDVVFRVLRQVHPEDEGAPRGGWNEGRNHNFPKAGLFLFQNQADALFMLPEQKQVIVKGGKNAYSGQRQKNSHSHPRLSLIHI